VASVMTSPVITGRPYMSFKELVTLLAAKKIGAVPVVDERGRPLGVVSEADVMAKQEFHGGTDERLGSPTLLGQYLAPVSC